MSDDWTADDERIDLLRQVRQRLDALARAGLDRVPRPPRFEPRTLPATAIRAEPPPVLRVAEAPVSPPVEPSRPPATPRPVAPPPRPTPALASSLFEEPNLPADVVAPADRPAVLALIQAEVAGCVRCPHLAATRTQTVFGTGNPNARLMFVGEGPGADEDRTGLPFVGKAGQLLDDMISKGMGLKRADVYIANVVKCRPLNTAPDRTSDNRPPTGDEMANCMGYLEGQIALIRPEFLCLLGKTPASALLETAMPMARLRGKWHRFRGIPTIVTYHPAALLRKPEWKKDTWEDLKMLMTAMGIKPPERKKGG